MAKNKPVNAGLSDLDALLAEKGISHEEALAAAKFLEEQTKQPEPQKLSPLARCYIAEAVGSCLRTPSLKLNTDYRLELLTRKASLDKALKATGSEAAAVIEVAKELATRGDLFDAQKLLQHVMAQTLWMGAVDIGRSDRATNTFDEHAFEHDLTHGVDAGDVGRDGAPYGLQDAADNEDAILGFAGDSEKPALPTYEEIHDAVTDVNLWLGILADAIGLLPIPFTSIDVGTNARGKKLWREITDLSEALRIQRDRNLKALQKRNAVKAAEAVLRNAAVFEACIAQAA